MPVAIMGLRVKEIPKEMTTRKEARLWTNEFDAQIVNHYSSYHPDIYLKNCTFSRDVFIE